MKDEKEPAQSRRSGSKRPGGMKKTKCLSLGENADSTKLESAPPAGPCEVNINPSAIPEWATTVGLAHDHPGAYEGWYSFSDSGPQSDITTLSHSHYYGFLATDPQGRVLMFDPALYSNWLAPGAPPPVCYLQGPSMGVRACQ